jgi:hypothetical protein
MVLSPLRQKRNRLRKPTQLDDHFHDSFLEFIGVVPQRRLLCHASSSHPRYGASIIPSPNHLRLLARPSGSIVTENQLGIDEWGLKVRTRIDPRSLTTYKSLFR